MGVTVICIKCPVGSTALVSALDDEYVRPSLPKWPLDTRVAPSWWWKLQPHGAECMQNGGYSSTLAYEATFTLTGSLAPSTRREKTHK